MGENEESDLVREAIEGGVKVVNSLADYFSKLIGCASSVSELRQHSENLNEKVYQILVHLLNNTNCTAATSHLTTVAAITQFYSAPVMANVCCGESFAVFRERAVRLVRKAADEQIERMRSERSVEAVRELISGLAAVEVELAKEQLHGATRH